MSNGKVPTGEPDALCGLPTYVVLSLPAGSEGGAKRTFVLSLSQE